MTEEMICVGKIIGSRGIKGQVKIQSFTEDPISINKYGDIFDANFEKIKISNLKILKNDLLTGNIFGCDTKEKAEVFSKKKLFVKRQNMPEPQNDEYYFSDLKNLQVLNQKQIVIGKVSEVQDYGAGTFLEIKLSNEKLKTLPFNKDSVLEVTKNHITIDEDFLL